jgi:sulfate adenylyltransferase
MRKNYGCTHFIVGRDHAGVGNYYRTYDAHRIFDSFTAEEIGITPCFSSHLLLPEMFRDGVVQNLPTGTEEHVTLSGTKVREMLKPGDAARGIHPSGCRCSSEPCESD